MHTHNSNGEKYKSIYKNEIKGETHRLYDKKDIWKFKEGGEVPLLTGRLEERRKKFSELKLKFKKDGRGYYSSSINVDGNNWKWLIEGSEKHWSYSVEKNGKNGFESNGCA